MSATVVSKPSPGPGRAPVLHASQARAFTAVLRRDVYVTGKELPVFLAQVILQPLFLLFVFGKVLSSLGYTQHGYSDLLFPGLLALTAVITGMQSLAFPLVIEFGWTRRSRTDCSRRCRPRSWPPRRSCSPRCARSSPPRS